MDNEFLDLCRQNQQCITNTFYESQVYTWYKWNDITIKSQIDYKLTRVKDRYKILDAKAIPNSLLDSDHKIVMITTRCTSQNKRKTSNKKQGLIKITNLKKEGITEQLKQHLIS